MESVIVAMVGLVGVLLAAGAGWIRAGFRDLRSAMEQGFAAAEHRVAERFDKVDARFDHVEVILRDHGERIARMEGALAASGVPVALRPAALEHPTAGGAAAEAATG